MIIKEVGIAGTLESSDITISIEPNVGKGIEIMLTSTVERQFGRQVRKAIRDSLEEMGITDALVHANDKGALDCTIQARVMTAVSRATGTPCSPWEVK
ncbi:citrate lyase acyl carrier protein [Desulfosporosinus orientis DSM 765]|uniref:Citrate lyase acyl carrier protein n=1 Tax=Desulfosporosinus orientis (strain ATCC 19365 / DSM 765 / NCIMB 8382 / VKM B-1628 / Singapore I) TaxID=768706 RepID=G7W721_DESOD|nr:citrate lyase acyl carrier protein [Desulfosporosinus orientis]AET69878.1 citrate lyase acyl carrier protein [Desulfosporosinus orientis DSM 765]